MNNSILYIAGPMSGVKDFNHAEFNRVAKRLRDAGRRVVNPAECDNGSTDKPWSYYMRHALRGLLDCDEVLCLPGWEKSKGARLEVTVALALGMPVEEITDEGEFGHWTNYVDEVPPPAVEKAPEPEIDNLTDADPCPPQPPRGWVRVTEGVIQRHDHLYPLGQWATASIGLPLPGVNCFVYRHPHRNPKPASPTPPAVEKAQPQPQETILQEADRLVSGDRQSAYGHPYDDFTRTGKLWAAILDLDTVTPEQVALCMVALKISRECHKPKRDNRVDGAGYFKCLDLVVQACEGGAK